MRLSLLILLFSIAFGLSAAVCTDSTGKFKINIRGTPRNRRCKWVAKKTNKRCDKRDINGTFLKDHCPLSCNVCPTEPSPTDAPVLPPTDAPVLPPTETPTVASGSSSGCCTLDYKACVDWCGDTEDSCGSCGNTDVGWIPNGAPTGDCAARWVGCQGNPDGCCAGLTCQESGGWYSCTPGDSTPTPPNPTNPPQANPTVAPVSPTTAPVPPTVAPVPPTTAPVPPTVAPVSPTTAPVPPTVAPVSPTTAPVSPTTAPVQSPTTPPNDNGCCSLDYKTCVSWCGSTEDACNSCGNQEVVWLSNGPDDTCGERWSGCGQDNDNSHSGCCNGLTCQWRGDGHDYFSCLPGDGTPTPPNPTTPPQPNPTNPPQSSPTNPPQESPVSSPTTGGDWISGKATMYGGNPSGGACGYNDLPQVSFPYGLSVAIGGDEFDNGYGCGACYEVICEGPATHNPGCFCGDGGQNKVIVQATDQCPECDSTHLDLNTAAFTSFVKDQDSGMAGTCGIVETSFRRVSCDFESNIKIRSKSGTSGYWYGLHVDDVAGYGAIQSVKLREAGRRYNGQDAFDIVCQKSENASYWLCDRPQGRQIFANLDVELVDSAGRILRTNDVITNLNGGQEFDFRQNYEPIPDGAPTAPTPTPPVSPTTAPVPAPTQAPAPTTPFNGELLSTDNAMNAWEVFQGVDYITHKNSESPPNYALVAS